MSLLLRGLRSESRGRSNRGSTKSFAKHIGRSRLRLEHLEQRALLDAAGAATHFALLAPANETAGKPAPLELTALDASNHPVQNFTGAVSFTSSDAKATLPADYTFAASDHGHHLFHITLATPGSETVTATDAADKISGNITVNVNPAPVATHFFVYAPEDAMAGEPTSVVIVALDASNHRVNDYTGTVDLTTNDPGVTTPLKYTFTTADHGRHVFKETFATGGTWTVTATDEANSKLTGTTSIDVEAAPVATHFLVYAPENTTVGKPTSIVVVALDASNDRVEDYTGTVDLSTNDPGVTTPLKYTFTAADHGRHVFKETFATVGSQTVTATDEANAKLTGTATINVNPAPVVTHFALFADGSVFSGEPFSLEVVALDASNHRVPNYTGTVHLASSVSGETLPADYTFTAADEGEHEFQATLNTVGADTLSASDGKLTGSVTVNVQTAPTGGGGGGGGQDVGDQDNDGPSPSTPANVDAFFAAYAETHRWRG